MSSVSAATGSTDPDMIIMCLVNLALMLRAREAARHRPSAAAQQ